MPVARNPGRWRAASFRTLAPVRTIFHLSFDIYHCHFCAARVLNEKRQMSNDKWKMVSDLTAYFLFIPRWMMFCISSAFGIPRSVAGLSPNGPPSVLAMNVMLSPVA